MSLLHVLRYTLSPAIVIVVCLEITACGLRGTISGENSQPNFRRKSDESWVLFPLSRVPRKVHAGRNSVKALCWRSVYHRIAQCAVHSVQRTRGAPKTVCLRV